MTTIVVEIIWVRFSAEEALLPLVGFGSTIGRPESGGGGGYAGSINR